MWCAEIQEVSVLQVLGTLDKGRALVACPAGEEIWPPPHRPLRPPGGSSQEGLSASWGRRSRKLGHSPPICPTPSPSLSQSLPAWWGPVEWSVPPAEAPDVLASRQYSQVAPKQIFSWDFQTLRLQMGFPPTLFISVGPSPTKLSSPEQSCTWNPEFSYSVL